MITGRRLAAAAVAGLLTLGGVAACQSDPTVAAYVDEAEIHIAEVSGVVEALRTSYEGELETELASLAEMDIDEGQVDEYRMQGREEIDNRIADARDRVLTMLVLTEAAAKYADAEDITPPDPQVSAIAQEQQLDEDHPYVTVVADFSALVGTVVQARAEPAAPSEEDQYEVYGNLRVDGEEMDLRFEEVEQFLTPEALSGPVGVRDIVAELINRVDVRVQPGFDLEYQVPVQLGGVDSFLGVQISQPSSVRDAD